MMPFEFTVRVSPNESNYSYIVVHGIDPNGGVWDYRLDDRNSISLYLDKPSLVGKWQFYADVYNEYGAYYGSDSGPYATINVRPFDINEML